MTSEDRKRTEERRKQQLADRQAYRDTLLNRREEVEKKIASVEADIKALRGKA